MLEELKKLRQHLLTGVSYAIPFIACGGIMIAGAIAFVPIGPAGPDFSQAPKLKLVLDIGATAFALMLPVLAGYIAYSIAGKPGLVAGFIGGYLSGQVKAGFLGAILAGLLAGYIVQLIKKIPVSKHLKPIMPILIIPILSSAAIGVIMLKVLGTPIAQLMTAANGVLKGMSSGNAVVLALLLGAMIAFDMGGPVNKAAFFFGVAMIAEKNYAVMGACAAAICIPPLGLGLATMLGRFFKGANWSERERDTGIAALAMGSIGITEGAIPFAAGDPLRVIPTIMLGSMVGAVIAMLGGSGDHAPHGGLIVLPVVDGKLNYILAVAAGALTVAVSINLLRAFTGAKDEE